jgi:drug/metabolite transporter (DMT)-like permease
VRQVVSSGWCFLAAMILAYGVANLLQSAAAARTTVHHTFDPSLLVRLAGQRTYLLGLGCQVLGFVLAFLAREDLPLFLVQASVAAGLGVTALLGVLLLKWSLPRSEVVLLVLLMIGIAALVKSAQPAHARPLGTAGIVGLGLALLLIAGLSFSAVRLQGALGSVVLGSLAGVGFSAAAIAARPLATEHSAAGFFANPLLYLLIAHSLVGQLLLGLAMQRGSTTAAVAAMDAAGAVPAAVVGLLLLGDRIEPGKEWLAALGFVVTLASVIALTRYAEPQHHQAPAQPPTRRHEPSALRTAPTSR